MRFGVMSGIRQPRTAPVGTLRSMGTFTDGLLERFVLASSEFERKLRAVRSGQWSWPTPCTEWNVRQLVNHMARGNLSYLHLLRGGTSADFLRLRDADALGADPLAAYTRSARECAEAFAEPGALGRVLDYPLGRVPGYQALAVRTTDSAIHTWDLARATGDDDTLDAGLVAWIDDHLEEIYAGLAETPTAADTTHRFFAAPGDRLPHAAPRQHRLLHRMGRNPGTPSNAI
ncbi:TIGR03086 family metal-binding protein [Amycolatopsis anabasis]|uniref:TIGR03086 family metal-binding protein n=1 Tax=Amycolatopsis anabasis TaxID=1840409 RepID=UPI001FE3227F|nr:TIGR03086 family metal-binding protein [Amycolatopsis anabasis]